MAPGFGSQGGLRMRRKCAPDGLHFPGSFATMRLGRNHQMTKDSSFTPGDCCAPVGAVVGSLEELCPCARVILADVGHPDHRALSGEGIGRVNLDVAVFSHAFAVS